MRRARAVVVGFLVAPPVQRRWGCRRPCPGTGAGAPPPRRGRGVRAPPRPAWRPGAWCRGRSPRPPPPPRDRLRPRPRCSFLRPSSCRGRSDWGRRDPPKRALPIAVSAACHSQSTPPNSSSHFSTNEAQIRSKTPSSTHRWKARCTEESSGNSFGRRFHWQPVRSRKMTASRTARWSLSPRAPFPKRQLGSNVTAGAFPGQWEA